MQQVFHNKGGPGGGSSKDEKWHDFFEHDGTKLKMFPLPEDYSHLAMPARRMVDLVEQRQKLGAARLLTGGDKLAITFSEAAEMDQRLFEQMIALQEELDWEVYRLFGLLGANGPPNRIGDESLDPLALGWRSFEIELARSVANGSTRTKWFQKLGAVEATIIPCSLSYEVKELTSARIAETKANPNIRLLEQVNYKRRWEQPSWWKLAKLELRDWLLGHIEAATFWSGVELQTTASIADRASQDAEFVRVAELYAERPDFDVAALVRELVDREAVPVLPASRYKASGLRKRAHWEETWRIQRQEDTIYSRAELDPGDPEYLSETEAKSLKRKEVGEIPVPPKYATADFQKNGYWRLRGKLDVPKERFVSFPHCERVADASPVVGWAGWNHLELAQATAAYYLEMKEQEGWDADRLTPLLLALLEVLPWAKQWHNELDPQSQVRMGDYFEDFVNEEARALGLTIEQIESWTPPKKTRTVKPREKAARKKKTETEAKPA